MFFSSIFTHFLQNSFTFVLEKSKSFAPYGFPFLFVMVCIHFYSLIYFPFFSRIPDSGRFELRLADGAVNPYLLQAAILCEFFSFLSCRVFFFAT